MSSVNTALLIPGADNDLITAFVRGAEFATVEKRDADLRRRGWLG